MNSKIDPAFAQGLLDFLGKKPLAAQFREIAILHHIAGRLDDFDLANLINRLTKDGGHTCRHVMGLNEREPGAAGANAVATLHLGSLKLYALIGRMTMGKR